MRNIEDPSFSKMVEDDGDFGLIVRVIYATWYFHIRICEAALSQQYSYESRVVQIALR